MSANRDEEYKKTIKDAEKKGSTGTQGCSLCGSQHMIPVSSPRGQTLLTQFHRR